MKKLLIFAFLLCAKSVFAQKINKDTVGLNVLYADGTVTYEKVYNAGKISQALLYSNAKIWFMAHSIGKQPVLAEDSALYRLVAKATDAITFEGIFNMSSTGNINYTIQIDCKDGRYRCRIFNVTMQYTNVANNTFDTSANNMMAALTGGANHTGLNTNQLKRAFAAINTIIWNTMASINKTMADNNDF